MEKKTLVPIVGIHSSGKSTILDILNKKGFITQGECAEEIRVTKNVKAGALADSSFEELVKKEELKRDKIRNWKDEKVIFVESWHVLTLSYMLTRGKNIDEIADYMEALGFEMDYEDEYHNEEYEVFDAVPNNVLYGIDNKLYFINTQIRLRLRHIE